MMPATISKKDLLAKPHQLPSLPLVVQQVIASFNEADLDTASLTDKIAQDQGLSAKVLRVAWAHIETSLPQPDQLDAGVDLLLAT